MMAYRLGLYEKSMPNTLTLREKLEQAKEAGFDYLELSIDETDEKLARLSWTKEERLALKRDMEETGIPIHSICLSGHRKYPLGHPDAQIREKSMRIMEQAIVLANDLGIRLIQLAGYDVYYEAGSESTRSAFMANIRKSAQIAALYGVTLAFETMETDFMNTVEKAMTVVRKVNSPWLQVYPDLGNLTNASILTGHTVVEDLKKGAGHLSAMHLKETVPGVFREVPYGTGHVNYEEGIRQALDLGVRCFVGEFWYTGSPVWKEDLKSANGFLRGRIAEAEKQKKQ